MADRNVPIIAARASKKIQTKNGRAISPGYAKIGDEYPTLPTPQGKGKDILENIQNFDSGGDVDDGGEIPMPRSTADANNAAAAGAIKALTPDKKAPDTSKGLMNHLIGRQIPTDDRAVAGVPQMSMGANNAAPAMPLIANTGATTYDRGGLIKPININDGQHQLAIVKNGERVLNPLEAQRYNQGKTTNGYKQIKMYDSGGTVDADESQLIPEFQRPNAIPNTAQGTKSTGYKPMIADPRESDVIPQRMEQSATKPEALMSPEESAQRKAVNVDVRKALGSGDLVALGKARLAEQHLPDTEDAIPRGVTAPAALQPIGGKRGTGLPQMQMAPDPNAPAPQIAPRTAEPAPLDHKAKLASYDQQMADARDAGDKATYDRVNWEKQAYIQSTPFGSTENHPGVIGKILHGLARTGETAANIITPGITTPITGSDLNMAAQRRNAIGQINTDTDNALKTAETAEKNQATKTAGEPKPKEEEWSIVPGWQGPKGEAVQQEKNSGQTRLLEGMTPEKKDLKAGEQTATAAQMADVNTRITNSPYIPKEVQSTLQFPAGYTPTSDEAKERLANIKDVEDATRQSKQDEANNAIRKVTEQNNVLMTQAHLAEIQKTDEAKGRKMVIGTNPSTNREEMVPEGTAKDRGLKDVYDAPADAVNKALSARHFIPLADNTDPKDPGILQMIDTLDSEGKLGTIASRWNDFMAGKVGAGDPDFERLRVAMGLATTLLMNAHVGSRGGSYMMEHFEDLANAKKMDAKTLRAGVDQELKYIKNRAMEPNAIPSAGENKYHYDSAKGPIFSNDGKVWYDAQGKKVGK